MKLNFNSKFVVITGDWKSNELDTGIYTQMFLDAIHPSRQLNLILNSLEDSSEYLIWIVNNDVTMSHINNLVLLGQLKNSSLSQEQGYKGLFLEPKDVSVFEFTENKELLLLESGEYGYVVPWMSKHLEELFDKTISIQDAIKGEIEV